MYQVLIGEKPASNIPSYRTALCVVTNVVNLEDQERLYKLKTELPWPESKSELY
jgi:hypothetical protein